MEYHIATHTHTHTDLVYLKRCKICCILFFSEATICSYLFFLLGPCSTAKSQPLLLHCPLKNLHQLSWGNWPFHLYMDKTGTKRRSSSIIIIVIHITMITIRSSHIGQELCSFIVTSWCFQLRHPSSNPPSPNYQIIKIK